MRKILTCLVLSLLISYSAMAEGMKYMKASNLAEAIETAKKDGMILMVEMYREKCPACFHLETDILPSDVVGDALNSNIICYRIDGEKGEGIDIMKKYRGIAFPTLFFFKDGSFIERSVGSGDTAENFVERIHNLLVNYDLTW